MAEISYPFAAASAGGGSELVSQTQWQDMAHLWASDRINFQLTNASYSNTTLPFWCEFADDELVIHPGAGWVGGFYYELTAPKRLPAPTNADAMPRKDFVVIRLDMALGSANLAIKEGQSAPTAREPEVQRTPGGIWEMPLWAVELEPRNGTRTLKDRRRFDSPGGVQTPWYRSEVSQSLPAGSFTLDMDSNGTGGQQEGFRGRDGDMVTRHLSKRQAYTPDLFTVTNKPPAANRTGLWRYIAPGTVQFSAYIRNTSTNPVSITSSWYMGLTLPVICSQAQPMVLTGVLNNSNNRDGLPNLVAITAQTSPGTKNCALYMPSTSSLASGLDGLDRIPGQSDLTVSGVFETNDLEGISFG